MDLDAYFARIGYRGSRAPDRATLAAIIRHHAASIPFEAIDVLLGKGIDIAQEAVFDKLVRRRRGGYCFEQNGLLLQALMALGFEANARLARVLWMRPADAPPLRATHMVLIVRIVGRDYLADAGFGNGTPTAPLALGNDGPQETPLETFRLRRTSAGHVLEMQLDENWAPVYEILQERPTSEDFADANRFTSTHPESRFRRDLMLARATANARHLLLGNRLTVRPAQGEPQIHRLESASDLRDAMATFFALAAEPDWEPLLARFTSIGDGPAR